MNTNHTAPSLDSLTARESEVLRLIGRGLDNREIAQRLVVSLDTVRWYGKQIYSKLNVHSRTEAVIRAGELGLLAGGTIAKNRSEELRPFAPPQRTLPVTLTSLVGRSHDTAAVKELFDESRFVTLTGPAGVGKTRLAVQVATEMAPFYTHGVVFVGLAPVSDAAWVASAVATTLGVTGLGNSTPGDMIKAYLRQRQMLLVLDNFEHVMSAAPLVGELLESAPALCVLATSREALHLYGEREYIVPPLGVPESKHEPTPDMLAKYDAVSLFVERAQALKPNFTLTHENAYAVAEICLRLDGLPLAIELAAARIKMFGPQALARRLDNPLTLLSTGARNAPNRQQTLRAAIAWSYDLLTPPEQMLFAYLGVAPGSWSLEAIDIICGRSKTQVVNPVLRCWRRCASLRVSGWRRGVRTRRSGSSSRSISWTWQNRRQTNSEGQEATPGSRGWRSNMKTCGIR
jgi:DNA-binding CsgD family transcriptional regulator